MLGDESAAARRIDAIESRMEEINEQIAQLTADVTRTIDRVVKAIGHSVIAGFTFQPTEPGGVALLRAERRRGGAVDVYEIRSGRQAKAARFRADAYGDPSAQPIWQAEGIAADVINQLLALAHHGSPGSPPFNA